ncbi:RstR1 [Pantoea ananatis LMG 20103]|uniref:RstR1 n=2 Tax=Pantoea ananas TaxID=553 RepID=D4GL31_PANAM|nr:RstR1 [Pantoea ananatis LMG 20103]
MIMNDTIDYQRMFWMSFSTRFLSLRKEHGLTQPQMADKVGIHLTQVRRYESREAQPSLDILKHIAVTFNVSADWLIFEGGEREPQDELKFEAIKQMDEEELKSVTSILDALILKHQARRVMG